MGTAQLGLAVLLIFEKFADLKIRGFENKVHLMIRHDVPCYRKVAPNEPPAIFNLDPTAILRPNPDQLGKKCLEIDSSPAILRLQNKALEGDWPFTHTLQETF